jgi:hypothetical protein
MAVQAGTIEHAAPYLNRPVFTVFQSSYSEIGPKDGFMPKS